MLMAAYSAALGLGLTASAPWWLMRMATTRRYREGLGERLGRVPARLRAAVAGKRVVWVHAVSVGEVLAVSRLVAELEATLNADGLETKAGPDAQTWTVVISTTTRTGQALTRERFGAERVFYFPLDFAFAVRAYLHVLRPAMLVLAEGELWPRMLHECERAGVPVAVVNARVSDRSFRRALRVRAVWGRVMRKVTLWLAQSAEDARRLVALGAVDGSVRVSGNLKYDVHAPGESAMVKRCRVGLHASGGDLTLVLAGSTVEGEESALLGVWGSLQARFPKAVLMLAPRHPERFDRVRSLICECGFTFANCSALPKVSAPVSGATILLLDTIGDLAAMYQLASIAFVGGSLVARGGHNPLEPAQFGVPVIMGPHFENFRDVVVTMQRRNAIAIAADAKDFERIVTDSLEDRSRVRAMGERGRGVFALAGGATARSVAALQPLLESSRLRASTIEVMA